VACIYLAAFLSTLLPGGAVAVPELEPESTNLVSK
jgi:hypothetical protein